MMKERKPNRLHGYDYSSDNLYFITSCVHNRICCFGEIVPVNPEGTGRDLSLHPNDSGSSVRTGRDLSLHPNDSESSVRTGRDLSVQPHSPKMILNEFGEIAENQWHWLAEQYPYVVLHAFVVMPNHIHGIIEINRMHIVRTGRDLSVQQSVDLSVQQSVDLSVQQSVDLSLQQSVDLSLQQSVDLSLSKIKSLSGLMGAYKTTVSKQIHLMGFTEFAWQRSFFEQIIRDRKAYNNISDYIITNPARWEQDKLNNHE
jgi:putative transposase